MNKYAARALLEDLSYQNLKIKLRHMTNTLHLTINTDEADAEIFLEKSSNSRNLFTVQNSVASKNLGPLLYDLAMEYLTDRGGWMTCDRWGSVSTAAHHVWDQYLHRRQDVIKQQLTRIETKQDIYDSINTIGYMSLYRILVNNDQEEFLLRNYGAVMRGLAGGTIRDSFKLEQEINVFLKDDKWHSFLTNAIKNDGTNYKYRKEPSLIRFIDVYAEIDY